MATDNNRNVKPRVDNPPSMADPLGVTLLDEFRWLCLQAHRNHHKAWKDCDYSFCRRRYQLFSESSYEVKR